MKKSILLTNYEMSNFAGSEIDTMTIAKYFIEDDYEVSIFTLYYDYPIKEAIDAENIKVITAMNIDELKNDYDIIWAHHYPLLDYLLFCCNVTAKKIIYTSLSSFLAIESVPDYWKDLTLLLANSVETKKVLVDQKVDSNSIEVFPNYAPKSYFQEKIELNKKIKKICIVSNHVPQELIDSVQIMKANKIKVDIFGLQYKPVFVDDTLLKKYDVIISIGKTVNYGIALGIPVYCYDHFGGPGYITPNNYKQAFEFNFSGRSFDRKLTAEELVMDVINNYSTAIKYTKKIRQTAYNDFCFEKNMKTVIKIIENCENVNVEKILKKYPLLIRKSKLFIDNYKWLLYFNQEYKKNHRTLVENQKELDRKNQEHMRVVQELNSINNSKGYKILIRFYTLKQKMKLKK